MPDAEVNFRPTPNQFDLWGKYVPMEGREPDEQGDWLGWCPLHDPQGRKNRKFSAIFNFHRGSMRCLADKPCHEPKRAISLTNLAIKM